MLFSTHTYVILYLNRIRIRRMYAFIIYVNFGGYNTEFTRILILDDFAGL